MTVQPNKAPRLRFRIGNDATSRAVKSVLAYEAAVRNRSRSQAGYELVMESVDLERYPEEVRARLAAIEDQMRRRAASQLFD